MTLDDWSKTTEIIDHVVVSLAAMVGGVWAFFRFIKERTDEAALNITVETCSTLLGSDYLEAIKVKLENKGKTRIVAKAVRSPEGFAFDDEVEKLRYCCTLQIKKFRESAPTSIRHVDWFETGAVEDVSGLNPQINLLIEYENPQNNNDVDFYLEPGEIYHLEMPVVLPKGSYLAKVSFIAAGGDANFWSRVFTFTVPAADRAET